MYLPILTEAEQLEIVQALRGPQFLRKNHGSLWDRGSADSYYGRSRDPHYGGVGGDSGTRVEVNDDISVAEYHAGYTHNELYGHKKEWL